MMELKGQINFSYDRENDVLYMPIDKPEPATSIEMGNGVLVRLEPGTINVVGITWIDFMRRIHSKLKEIKDEDHEH